MKLLNDSLCATAFGRGPDAVHTEQPFYNGTICDPVDVDCASQHFNCYSLQLWRGRGDFPDLHATMPYIEICRARVKDWKNGTDDRKRTRIYFYNRETWE